MILMPFLLSCFIQGTYSLQVSKFNQPQYPIQITGYINSGTSTTYINWQGQFKYASSTTAFYTVDGSFKGEWLHLDLSIDSLKYEISGSIHGQPVSWSSISNWIYGIQNCIQ